MYTMYVFYSMNINIIIRVCECSVTLFLLALRAARLFYCGGKHVSLMVKNGETGKHSMCTIHIVRYTKEYN